MPMDLVLFGLMAYQLLMVILSQILFLYIPQLHNLYKKFVDKHG